MNKIVRKLFYELESEGNNGIIGPGYRYWKHYRISYGKLSFILLLLSIIILIFNI